MSNAFSLLELMIVLIIVAILSSIALPSYQKQVLIANRADGKIALLSFSADMERFYTENNAYNATGSPALAGAYDSENGHYKINKSDSTPEPSVSATTYLATATAQGAQTKDINCLVLTINHLSQKTPAECW